MSFTSKVTTGSTGSDDGWPAKDLELSRASLCAIHATPCTPGSGAHAWLVTPGEWAYCVVINPSDVADCGKSLFMNQEDSTEKESERLLLTSQTVLELLEELRRCIADAKLSPEERRARCTSLLQAIRDRAGSDF